MIIVNNTFRHMFTFDIEQPAVVYTAEDRGAVSRIDLRETRESTPADTIFYNVFREVVEAGERTSYALSVKCVAQSRALGGSHLIVGGGGFTVGLLDLRLLPATRPTSQLQTLHGRDSFVDRDDGSNPIAGTRMFVKCWGPQYVSRGCMTSAVTLDSPTTPRHLRDVSCSGLCCDKTGRRLLVSYQTDQIYTFDVNEQPVTASVGVGARSCIGGHLNHDTFLKSVAFFGPQDEYILSGCDHGYMWIWDSSSGMMDSVNPLIDGGAAADVWKNHDGTWCGLRNNPCHAINVFRAGTVRC